MHRPAALPCRLGQGAVGVEGPGSPHGLEVEHVLSPVAVGVGLREVNGVLLGEGLNGRSLAWSPEDRAVDPSGDDAVEELDLGDQQVLDPEILGGGLGLEPGG